MLETAYPISTLSFQFDSNSSPKSEPMMIRQSGPLISSSLKLKSPNPNPIFTTPPPHFHVRRSTATMSSSASSIEHLVLFKVKPDTTSHNLSAMIDGLNSLSSQIHQLKHISAGPIHRNHHRSGTVFTHLLHSRYRSKDDLAAYSAHPSHVAVVKDKVLPVCEEIMAVDWIANDLDSVNSIALTPGSALRITLLKLKDDSDKEEVLKIVKSVSGGLDKVVQSSVGENFSPARAKGFSVASLAVFKGLEDLEEAKESKKEVLESYKEKVRAYVDGVVDVEYVIPSLASTQSANL